MTARAPRVSLCLFVRNEARFIAETLDSIARQTFGDFEAHVFDNASDDATPEICARYLHDPRFRYFRNGANIGVVANFNRCRAIARGHYVGILSGNDVLADTYLEKLVALADSDPAIGLVTARIQVIAESSAAMPQTQWVAPTYFETDPEEPIAAGLAVLRHWRYGSYLFGLYRRDVLEGLQPLRPLYGADAALVLELALRARIRVHPEVLFHLRHHGSPQVSQVQASYSEDLLYGVIPTGIFTHFDLITPFIDQTWCFLETTSFTPIDPDIKVQLSNAILANQRARWLTQIAAEVATLKEKAPRTLAILRARPDAAVFRALAYRLVMRLGRAALVAPPDAALSALVAEAAGFLHPQWPGTAGMPVTG